MVRVVQVTPDWHAYDVEGGGGWPAAVPIRESDVLKFFEVAIWEETKSIHFYEFDNDFDPYGWDLTPEERTARRESYRIQRVDGLPEPWTEARSRFIKQAFADFSSHLAARYPDSDHHLMYNGHGGPGGRLFAGQLTYRDAGDLLAHWTGALGRPLGVIDMGGPCNKGSFSDLENFCQHARYYVASDLPNGGFTMDDWTGEKYTETHPESQYHALLAGASSLEEALVRRIDLLRRNYEYSRDNMTESRTRQGNYLYSCRAFAEFRPAFLVFLSGQGDGYEIHDDLYDYLVAHGADDALLEGFDAVFVHRADNRDFFEWGPGANGLLMPSPDRHPAGANRSPVAVGTLEPLTIGDDAPVTVDVASSFRDPDGDALTYGATSSSPSVVSVSAFRSAVTVTPVAAGTAAVQVTATDPRGLSATQAFTVTVDRPPAPFTDHPIQPGVTPVRAVHFTELRTRIAVLRSEVGLDPFAWTDPFLRPGVTPVRLTHLRELREALSAAYFAAGRAVPRWTDSTPASGSTPIKAAHLMELRAAVMALE